jgi:hypothetical protein
MTKEIVLAGSVALAGCGPGIFPPPPPCTCPPDTVKFEWKRAERSCGGGGEIELLTQQGKVTAQCAGHGSCGAVCIPLARCPCFESTKDKISCACSASSSDHAAHPGRSGQCRNRSECLSDEVCIEKACVPDRLVCGDRLRPFEPCGGDIAGSWRAVDQCPTVQALTVSGNRVEVTNSSRDSAQSQWRREVQVSGVLTFRADGSMEDASGATLETTLQLPRPDPSRDECSVYTANAESGAVLRCDPLANGCRCTSRYAPEHSSPWTLRPLTPLRGRRPSAARLPMVTSLPALEPRFYCVRSQYLDVEYDIGRVRFVKDDPKTQWFRPPNAR